MKTNNANDPHPVRIILRDWSKTKKGNTPVAETHTKKKKAR